MSYKIGETTYDEWSVKNQRILDFLVEREVYCCMTSEVEYMLGRIEEGDADNPFDESVYDELYRPACPECGRTGAFDEKTIGELSDDEIPREHGYIDSLDDVGEGYQCPECGRLYETADEARDCCGRNIPVYCCRDCGAILNETEYDERDTLCPEIYEWWAVSVWFGEKLAEQGCVVLPSYGKSYWGRETTGQSISLDECVSAIAKNMGILEGMEHEWKV